MEDFGSIEYEKFLSGDPAGTFDLTIKRTENGRWKISGGSFLDYIMPRQG